MQMQKKATDNQNFILLITDVSPIIIETGPVIRRSVAVAEILNDEGARVGYTLDNGTTVDYRGGTDSLANPIVVGGEPMAWADRASSERSWNVYQWDHYDDMYRWCKREICANEMAAITAALALAAQPLPEGVEIPDRHIPKFPAE